MSFDRFLLAVESRNLSQADKSIVRVSSFPKWVVGSATSISVSQQLKPDLSAKWILSILSDLSLAKKLKKNINFSMLQIFEWQDWLKHQFCQIAKWQIGFFGIIKSSATHHSAGERRHSHICNTLVSLR